MQQTGYRKKQKYITDSKHGRAKGAKPEIASAEIGKKVEQYRKKSQNRNNGGYFAIYISLFPKSYKKQDSDRRNRQPIRDYTFFVVYNGYYAAGNHKKQKGKCHRPHLLSWFFYNKTKYLKKLKLSLKTGRKCDKNTI